MLVKSWPYTLSESKKINRLICTPTGFHVYNGTCIPVGHTPVERVCMEESYCCGVHKKVSVVVVREMSKQKLETARCGAMWRHVFFTID